MGNEQMGATRLLWAAGLGVICFAASCKDEGQHPLDPAPGATGSGAGTSSEGTSGAGGEDTGHGGSESAPTSSAGGPSGSSATGTGGATTTGGTSTTGGTPTTGGGQAGAAGSAGSAEVPLDFVSEPTFVGNPIASVPQAGVLRLETNLAAEVEVTVRGGGEEWVLTLPKAKRFEHPILGVKPDTSYSLSLRASTKHQAVTAGPLVWASPPLPDNFPTIDATFSEPAQMEPGMTLFNVNIERGPNPLVIVDHAGVVRWYYWNAENPVLVDPRRLANGHFLFFRAKCGAIEVDVLGNTITGWHAAEYPQACASPSESVPVQVPSLHHDIQFLPNGNLLALTTELRTVEGYPTSEDEPDAPTEPASVLTGVILEFTREGGIVKQIPLANLLDPTRIGRSSLSTSWPGNYIAEGEVAYDWDHANAVVYEEASDAYYVSLRHQDAVVKVSRATEELIWILGTPANWREPWQSKLLTPIGELEWFFHQHAIELNPLGLALYDNGNNRAAAFEELEAEFSRAVVYEVDEAAGTVEQVFSYGEASGDDFFFSPSRGDADWQPNTGNILLVNGKMRAPSGSSYAQVLEVTPDEQRVFELTVGDPAPDAVDTREYGIYRALRIADIRE